MNVIEVQLEDWQAQVYAAMAERRGLSCSELLNAILAADASQRVDSACLHLMDGFTPPTEIEHRLSDLFRR